MYEQIVSVIQKKEVHANFVMDQDTHANLVLRSERQEVYAGLVTGWETKGTYWPCYGLRDKGYMLIL